MPTTTISRCGGTPSGDTFPLLLLESSPNALWKMDELAGTTAFDTLAGSHDAGAVGTTPSWGQVAAPPGGFAPEFPFRGGFTTTLSGYIPDLSGDFSAAVFARIVTAGTQTYLGQGQPAGSQPGWEFYGVTSVGFNKYRATVWTGVTNQNLDSDGDAVLGAWAWLVLTHAGALWTFYVNGAAQATTYSGAYVSPGASKIWLGWDGTETFSIGGFDLSWGAIWATRAVAASEISTMYAAL